MLINSHNIEDAIKTVFDEEGKNYLPLLSALADNLSSYSYEIIPEEVLLQKSDAEEIKRIYCLEIMYRAHWASAASILRTHRWVQGILLATTIDNYLTFAAAFRGLIESAGDIIDALKDIPLALAENLSGIKETLDKKSKVIIDLRVVEEKLIHFTHARRLDKGQISPDYHRNKTNTDYIKQLQDVGESMMIDCYSELCQIAHPAAQSVMCFIDYDEKNLITLNNRLDELLIRDFCSRHKKVTQRILSLSLVSSICILKILNLLRVQDVITPEIDLVALNNPAWKKIEEKLKSSNYIY
jgi:hypothetical protein